MNRFFVPPDAIVQEQVHFPREAAHQIARVLRLRSGDRVAVLDGRGTLYYVVLEHVGRDEALGRVVGQEVATGEPNIAVTLYAALIKGERFEWILQKGTELGVSRFVPMVTERTVIRDLPSSDRQERWARIVREAAEQCGRARVPEVIAPVSFVAACAQAAATEVSLIAWEGEPQCSLTDVWGDRRPRTLALMVGPEGGFTADEAGQARAWGIVPFSLGPRVLRAETAAIVAVTLALQQAGELSPKAG